MGITATTMLEVSAGVKSKSFCIDRGRWRSCCRHQGTPISVQQVSIPRSFSTGLFAPHICSGVAYTSFLMQYGDGRSIDWQISSPFSRPLDQSKIRMLASRFSITATISRQSHMPPCPTSPQASNLTCGIKTSNQSHSPARIATCFAVTGCSHIN